MNSSVNPAASPASDAANTALAQEPHQFLTFVLDGETLGVGILNIREIIEYGGLTAVPMMPEFIRGVINLRGAVVPVIDLASRFGGRRREITRRTCIVIVELQLQGQTQVMGMIVDAVSAVLDIAPQDIQPPPDFGTRIRTDFISGMGRVQGSFTVLLDLDRVLSIEEMMTLSQLAAGHSPEVTHSSGATPPSKEPS